MAWDDARASFSRGAGSPGSGSPITFLDPSTCDDILADIRGPDGTLPDFGSIPSEPGSPPPALELEVTHSEQGIQTDPAPTQDQATQVLSRPHQGTSSSQTPALASTSDQGIQVLRPRQLWAFTQTERPATSTRFSWTQVPRVGLTDTANDIPPVLVTSTSCQAGRTSTTTGSYPARSSPPSIPVCLLIRPIWTSPRRLPRRPPRGFRHLRNPTSAATLRLSV